MTAKFQLKPFGRSALIVEWPERIDRAILSTIWDMQKWLNAQHVQGIIDVVSAYHSLTIFFNPTLLSFGQMENLIRSYSRPAVSIDISRKKWTIPVTINRDSGLDLEAIAQWSGLSIDEVSKRFESELYTVCFYGFLPGFVYLIGVTESLRIPRKKTPRLRVPPGSVAIAGEQAGVYPVESPGGWHIIGKTDFSFFDMNKNPPCQVLPGDEISFSTSLQKVEFQELSTNV